MANLTMEQMLGMYHDLSARVDDLTPRLDAVEETSQQIGPQGVPGPVSGGNEYQGYWSGLEGYEALETVTYNRHLYVAKVKIPKPPPPPGLQVIPNSGATGVFIPAVASVTPIGYYYTSEEFAEGLWDNKNEIGTDEKQERPNGTPIQLWQFSLHRENEAEAVAFEPIFYNFNEELMGKSTEAKREAPGGNLWMRIWNDENHGISGLKRQQQEEATTFSAAWGSAKLTKSFVIAIIGGLVELKAPRKGEYNPKVPQGYGLKMTSPHIVEPPEAGNQPPTKDPRWERIV